MPQLFKMARPFDRHRRLTRQTIEKGEVVVGKDRARPFVGHIDDPQNLLLEFDRNTENNRSEDERVGRVSHLISDRETGIGLDLFTKIGFPFWATQPAIPSPMQIRTLRTTSSSIPLEATIRISPS